MLGILYKDFLVILAMADSKPSALELAKQGNPRAIAALLNGQLQSKGITVKASLKEKVLRLLFESEFPPAQDQIIPWVENGFKSLSIDSVSKLSLYGKSFESDFPEWSYVIDLDSAKGDLSQLDKEGLITNLVKDKDKKTNIQRDNLKNKEFRKACKGTVLDYSVKNNQGIISGDDGRRYIFDGDSWNLNKHPEKGIKIDFEVLEDRALSIYEDLSHFPAQEAKKSKVTAGLLALLLGGFGAQFFYLGAWGWGIIALLFFWTYIPAIAGLIWGIRCLIMTDEKFNRVASKITSPFSPIEF